MNKRRIFVYLALFFMLITSPMRVSADIGPKPSVVIEFVGLEDEEYYVTLLSEDTTTGPYSVGNPYYEHMGDKAVFEKFSEYEDAGGFYFLSYMEDCSDDDTFAWTYYPPNTFKILIYFPEYDRFLMAKGIHERYAFDSYFTVEVSDLENMVVSNAADAAEIETRQSYDFTMEIISLFGRVILTIAIEVAIAPVFRYRDKKALTVITVTNVFTQVILNVLLNIINYRSGYYAFVFHYVWMEIAIFAIEAVIYRKLIGRVNPATNREYHPFCYAAAANILSFVAGMWIARAIPGIF